MKSYILSDMPLDTYVLKEDRFLELQNRFTYHPPIANQGQRYEEIRAKAFELAEFIMRRCPDSRELSLAMTHLEEAVFWANIVKQIKLLEEKQSLTSNTIEDNEELKVIAKDTMADSNKRLKATQEIEKINDTIQERERGGEERKGT